MSTDLTTTDAAELAQIEEGLAGASNLASFGATVPRIDVVQGTTKQPPADAKLGDLYNTVTGAVFGTSVEFLVAEAHKGRFLGGKRSPDGKTYAAGDTPVVPEHWPEQYRGRVFAELPEAQERYSAAANAGEIQWGQGPPIQDSFNFTGFVIKAAQGEIELFPVRLSLKSTSSKAARKAGTLLRGQKTLWTKALIFRTERETNSENEPYYVVHCDGYGDEPTFDQRKQAIEAALFAQQIGFLDSETIARATDAGDEPAAEGESTVVPNKGADF